ELEPARQLLDWNIQRGTDKALLTVQLREPLTAGAEENPNPGKIKAATGSAARLVATLRPVSAPKQLASSLPLRSDSWKLFQVAVPGARWREQAVGVDWDEQVFEGALNPPGAREIAPPEGPWGKRLPNVYFTYRDSQGERALKLTPRAPQFRVRCVNE